jgi:hypothetical protein
VSGGPFVTIGSTDDTSYTDATCSNGTTYYYVVTAANGGGETVASSQISARPLSPLQQWRLSSYGTIDPNDPIAGDLAMPRGDGISNLGKYALGMDPLRPTTAGLPSPGLLSGYLSLKFNRQKTASDITYRVEASSDISAWTEIWNSTGVPFGGGNNASESVTVSDNVPASGNSARRFLRLRITRP